ncbi:unnamed protein product [Rhizophagus irregularis]|nr:unnamed protein product [Rhizophagus irregularis]
MALSFGQTQNDKEAMPVVTVPTVNVPDSVIDQLNNEVGRAPSDLQYVENMSCIQIKQKTSIVWKPMDVWCHMYAMYGAIEHISNSEVSLEWLKYYEKTLIFFLPIFPIFRSFVGSF